jgi:hypothetical protein
MFALRYLLPAAVVLAGLILVAIDPSEERLEGAAAIVGAGLSIWLMNELFRVGARGDKERDDEQEAREYMVRHGHWPDET